MNGPGASRLLSGCARFRWGPLSRPVGADRVFLRTLMSIPFFSARRVLRATARNRVVVGYAVDPARVAPLLPDGLSPVRDDGTTPISLVGVELTNLQVLGVGGPGGQRVPVVELRVHVRPDGAPSDPGGHLDDAGLRAAASRGLGRSVALWGAGSDNVHAAHPAGAGRPGGGDVPLRLEGTRATGAGTGRAASCDAGPRRPGPCPPPPPLAIQHRTGRHATADPHRAPGRPHLPRAGAPRDRALVGRLRGHRNPPPGPVSLSCPSCPPDARDRARAGPDVATGLRGCILPPLLIHSLSEGRTFHPRAFILPDHFRGTARLRSQLNGLEALFATSVLRTGWVTALLIAAGLVSPRFHSCFSLLASVPSA